MMTQPTIEVTGATFEALGRRLEHFHRELPDGERAVFEWMLDGLGAPVAGESAGKEEVLEVRFSGAHRPIRIPFFAAVGGRLILGGNDGTTILILASGKIVVVPPRAPVTNQG
ncbi:MAG TPA: hypothetical protein VG406_08770 [Isosphaeraceae bacterium]|jgi:hypothetical protein|nr:hypothetical protein [Isosphaeraceae bacterium]